MFRLPEKLLVPDAEFQKLIRMYESGILRDSSAQIPEILLTEFALDVRARYGPIEIAHPIGKASGQLSLQPSQIETDSEAGLAFVVLKTVIAEDETGGASMEAWKVKKPRMVVERIRGKRVDVEGWTVSWAGRGWEGSLAQYLTFMERALKIGEDGEMPVIPSCKYHLPSDESESYRTHEYDHTTQQLRATWKKVHRNSPLVLEQDFSPTLAGTDAAQSKRLILKWLRETPSLIKLAAPDCILGVKLMNALFDDDFQIEMMRAVCEKVGAADFLICFNRLFDPARQFGDKTGIAYGGPDLSARNLEMLDRARAEGITKRLDSPFPPLPISATGDITSGRMMVEYAMRGATSGQLHTFFQLPLDQYRLNGVSRTRAALHEIYFHPENGLVAAMCHLRVIRGGNTELFRFLDIPIR